MKINNGLENALSTQLKIFLTNSSVVSYRSFGRIGVPGFSLPKILF